MVPYGLLTPLYTLLMERREAAAASSNASNSEHDAAVPHCGQFCDTLSSDPGLSEPEIVHGGDYGNLMYGATSMTLEIAGRLT